MKGLVGISDNRPIALFDSGLGGLTALAALKRLMPDENIIYFADTGRVPYGSKTVAQLKVMAQQDINLLTHKGAKAIIAACGTVSSNADDVLCESPIHVIGVLKPTIMRACALAGDAPIGLIATQATVASGAFDRGIHAIAPERELISAACPDFVTLIEGGHIEKDDELLCAAVEKYLCEIKEKRVSVLILGCTHYGIIADAIRAYLGDDVILLAAAECAAEAMRDYLISQELTGGMNEEHFYTSGDANSFSKTAALLLNRPLHGEVTQLEIMEVPQA